jgi:CBS domain-containing protein
VTQSTEPAFFGCQTQLQGQMTMLVTEIMTNEVVCCTPWDTARTAGRLMKERGVGAIPVVSDTPDPLLEGIVTDHDLCCSVVAAGKNADAISRKDDERDLQISETKSELAFR